MPVTAYRLAPASDAVGAAVHIGHDEVVPELPVL